MISALTWWRLFSPGSIIPALLLPVPPFALGLALDSLPVRRNTVLSLVEG